jgi:phospholipid-binding lipoprotein MlaA
LSSGTAVPVPPSVPQVRSRYSYDIDYGGQAAAAPYAAPAPGQAPLTQQRPTRFSYDVDYSGTALPQTYPSVQSGQQQVAVRTVAPPPAESVEPDVMIDPLEPMNRAIFAFNDVLDQVIFRPLAKLYSLTPQSIRNSMRRFFSNLNEPLIAVNDTLQFDLSDAGTALGRFAVNSTVGVLGLFDPATSFGLDAHHADFGQTLHSYGLGPGPYLVLPILGPSNIRDTVGRVGDIFLDPLTYALWDEEEIRLGLMAGNLLVKREELLVPLDDLRASSVDYYAATRGAYYQNRAVELAKGRANTGNKALDRLFDELE